MRLLIIALLLPLFSSDPLPSYFSQNQPPPPSPIVVSDSKSNGEDKGEWKRTYFQTGASVISSIAVLILGFILGKTNEKKKNQLDILIQTLRDTQSIYKTCTAILREEQRHSDIMSKIEDYGDDPASDELKRLNRISHFLQDRITTLQDQLSGLQTGLSIDGTMLRVTFGHKKSLKVEDSISNLIKHSKITYEKIIKRIDSENGEENRGTPVADNDDNPLVEELTAIKKDVSVIQQTINELGKCVMGSLSSFSLTNPIAVKEGSFENLD